MAHLFLGFCELATGSGPTADIERIATPVLEGMGFRLVRVRVSGAQKTRLQVMVERIEGSEISLDDCAAISRVLSPVLDVEDTLPGAYVLEVSSPGIDRPLTRLDDFTRFRGREARIETAGPHAGRRRFRGRLEGVVGATVRIAVEGAVQELAFAEIERANLVVTDEIITASLKKRAR